jgi:hypothetical protein
MLSFHHPLHRHLGCRPVQDIAEFAAELGSLSQEPHMRGTPNGQLHKDMVPAVMFEKVEPRQEQMVSQKAVELNVTRVVRSGNALHVQPPSM